MMNNMHFRVLNMLHNHTNPLSFEAVAEKLGYESGVTLDVLRELETREFVQEVASDEGVYDITSSGVRKVTGL